MTVHADLNGCLCSYIQLFEVFDSSYNDDETADLIAILSMIIQLMMINMLLMMMLPIMIRMLLMVADWMIITLWLVMNCSGRSHYH